MNLCFSTRGWTFASWNGFIDTAKELGFQGVEFYSLFREKNLFENDGILHSSHQFATLRALRDSGIEIPCFDNNIDLLDGDALDNLKMLIELAGFLKVPYVSAVVKEDTEETRERIRKLILCAEKNNVVFLIKTKGIFSDTSALRSLLDNFASDSLGVLWDMHYPAFFANETADDTIKNLGAYVKHVHLRDSDKNGLYTVIGEGTLPVDEMMQALSSIDYSGYISLEYKPNESEIGDYSYIFPHFIDYMERYNRSYSKKPQLYRNYNGTGYYIWKQNELINLTLSEVLNKVVENFPDKLAFKYTTLDYTRTYSEFRDDVDTFARALVALGVRPKSKVAVWATNVPEWFITFWSVTKIGAVFVSMNTAYKIHEAEYLLRQSDTHTLIMIEKVPDSNYREVINEICPEIEGSAGAETEGERIVKPLKCKRLPFLRNVITVGYKQRGALTFEEAMEKSRSVSREKIEEMAAKVRVNDVCNMQYTSGTTGFPKGVMLTHYNIVNNGKCIGDRMGLSSADRMMIQVPMFHCFGMVLSMTSSVTHAVTMCPMPYFSAKNSLACINQEKITCFNGVPTMFISMFNHPDYRNTDFSYMRTGIMAGSGCPPELMKRAALPSEMNMTGIVSVYGQTESSPGSTMSAWTDSLEVRTETVGYNFPYVECKIINPETGEEVPAGVNGEFCSRGYNTMKGYYKMPYATMQTVDKDGWLHSGDLACRDEAGNYKITGRLKDMIIRGGENIYPKEIEEFIYTHPSVKDVQVVGVSDKKYGEEAMAWIVLKDGLSVSEAEMRAFIEASLARHKVPRYIYFTDSFPMNAAGKIQKYKMREAAEKMLLDGLLK